MKTKIAAFVLALFLGLAPGAVALGATPCVQGEFCALAPIPGLTDQEAANQMASGINKDSFALFFNNLYKFLVGLAIALAIIEIIWGGLEYSTTDSIGNKEAGKNRIRNAIYGLLLILSPVLVFSIINPQILNLSIPFTPIDIPK